MERPTPKYCRTEPKWPLNCHPDKIAQEKRETDFSGVCPIIDYLYNPICFAALGKAVLWKLVEN